VSDHKSRMEGCSASVARVWRYRNLIITITITIRKLKIGRMETHDTCDPRPHLEVESLKVKVVTRPINAVTENQPYLLNGKGYELQTW